VSQLVLQKTELTTVPANYPREDGDDFLEGDIRMLKFKKITIVGLKAACSKTHYMILRGRWTNAQGAVI
jgi:hypothetical protein